MMNSQEQEFFSQLVYTYSGIALGPDKTYLFDNRLSEVAKAIGCPSISDLYRRAKFNMTIDLRDRIVEAMTTNETLFFRDSAPFEALRTKIIPDIIRRKGPTSKTLKIWSAACSSGQEAYSISMLLNESFPDILSSWNVEISGTDISSQVVERAKKGRYSQIEVNRGLPITYLIKYFKQQGSEWVVDDKIKKICKFNKLNLKDSILSLGSFDIIFCRYVLIYFDLPVKQKIFSEFIKLLGIDGTLFLGSSETIFGISEDFIKEEINKAIYYKIKR
jgi:chemotaxis protein methyltransferase CheR